jgi:hypothetical protein
MASYPGSKVHRRDRRKLGRGQVPPVTAPTLTITAHSADVARIVSNVPVVWGDLSGMTVATLTYASAAVVDQSTIDVTFSGALSGHAYAVPAGVGTAYNGGPTPAASGTF